MRSDLGVALISIAMAAITYASRALPLLWWPSTIASNLAWVARLRAIGVATLAGVAATAIAAHSTAVGQAPPAVALTPVVAGMIVNARLGMIVPGVLLAIAGSAVLHHWV
jgi:hypothetical protein